MKPHKQYQDQLYTRFSVENLGPKYGFGGIIENDKEKDTFWKELGIIWSSVGYPLRKHMKGEK